MNSRNYFWVIGVACALLASACADKRSKDVSTAHLTPGAEVAHTLLPSCPRIASTAIDWSEVTTQDGQFVLRLPGRHSPMYQSTQPQPIAAGAKPRLQVCGR